MIRVVDWITVPLSYPFMQRALVVSVLVGAVCAVLSCYLVLKGWSLMGDAISHAVLPGIVIAFAVGLPLAVGAFAAGLSCAVLTGYLKENSRVKEDTVMGIVFSGMFGLGLVLFSKVDTDQHLNHILFGNVLGVTTRDLVETAIVAGGTLLVVLLKRRDLLLYCFDPNHARAIGLPVRMLHYGLLILLSLTIVAVAQGGRHHPGGRDAGRAGRHCVSAHGQFRADACDCCSGRHRRLCARDDCQLPHRRRDRRLHRADPGRGFRCWRSCLRPSAGWSGSRAAGLWLRARRRRKPRSQAQYGNGFAGVFEWKRGMTFGVRKAAPVVRRVIGALVLAMSCVLCAVQTVSAQAWWDSIEDGTPELRYGFLPEPSIATSLPKNGDPAGFRKWLGDRGVVYGLEYTNDLLSNVRGGTRTGTINQGKLQGIVTVDFGKLAGWNGLSAFANFFHIHNTGRIRRDYVGGINTIAAIEANAGHAVVGGVARAGSSRAEARA